MSLTTAVIPLLGAWSIAVISPGPDFLVVIRASMTQSRRAGVFTAVGVVTGIGCWAVAALTGLSVLIDRYQHLYTELRLAGAIFLIGLGLLTLRDAWRASGHQAMREKTSGPSLSRPTSGPTVVQPGIRNWRLGLLTNLANPKALIFFGALFATLLPAGMGTSEKAIVLIVMLLMALTWFVGIALMGAITALNTWYRRLSRTIDFAAGGLFVVLGAALVPR